MKMTSFHLKIIAVITMTIDHIAKILGQPLLLHFFPDNLVFTYWLVAIMEWVGRLTFPIFAFFIAEGCRKTRSINKYIVRLTVFAIISEAFYYLAFHSTGGTGFTAIQGAFSSLLKFRYNNVFITLLLGAISIYIFQWLKSRKAKWLAWLIIPILLVVALMASYCHSDYEALGVLLIFALYFFQTKKSQIITILAWSTIFYLGWASFNGTILMWTQSVGLFIMFSMPWLVSCVSVLLLYKYNNERGRNMKWSFYVYYPAHLLVLFIIREVITPKI